MRAQIHGGNAQFSHAGYSEAKESSARKFLHKRVHTKAGFGVVADVRDKVRSLHGAVCVCHVSTLVVVFVVVFARPLVYIRFFHMRLT